MQNSHIFDLSKVLCQSIPSGREYYMSDRDRKKEQIKKWVDEDPNLLREILMDIRLDKIEKIKSRIC